MFLYCDPGLFADAYIITPDPKGEEIEHQWGCVSCYQITITGTVEEVKDEALAEKLITALGCDTWSSVAIKLATGLDVDEVLGESIMRLKDGRYVVVENCD